MKPVTTQYKTSFDQFVPKFLHSPSRLRLQQLRDKRRRNAPRHRCLFGPRMDSQRLRLRRQECRLYVWDISRSRNARLVRAALASGSTTSIDPNAEYQMLDYSWTHAPNMLVEPHSQLPCDKEQGPLKSSLSGDLEVSLSFPAVDTLFLSYLRHRRLASDCSLPTISLPTIYRQCMEETCVKSNLTPGQCLESHFCSDVMGKGGFCRGSDSSPRPLLVSSSFNRFERFGWLRLCSLASPEYEGYSVCMIPIVRELWKTMHVLRIQKQQSLALGPHSCTDTSKKLCKTMKGRQASLCSITSRMNKPSLAYRGI
jgi:hypothetical protein